MKRFTEDITESYYDSEDKVYRSFWDTEGSLHWGLFDESTGQDFLKACANLNEFMANKARLLPESTLLDIGCGNGNTAMWLSGTRECSVVGVDLSGVRINNAIQALEGSPAPLRDRVKVREGLGHGPSLRGQLLQPRMESGHHLPHPGQGGHSARGLQGAGQWRSLHLR